MLQRRIILLRTAKFSTIVPQERPSNEIVDSNKQKTLDSTDAEKSKIETTTGAPERREFVGFQYFREFFDKKSNWCKPEVKTGRPWQVDELRKKSNVDLHKLWFVLLKERNSLLTTQAEAKRLFVHFPGEERLYKVEESMENVENVVAERNNAYYELEYGRSARRPSRRVTTALGFHQERYLDEHLTPHDGSLKQPTGERDDFGYEVPYLNDQTTMFQKLYKEKLWLEKRDQEDDRKRELKQHKRFYKF